MTRAEAWAEVRALIDGPIAETLPKTVEMTDLCYKLQFAIIEYAHAAAVEAHEDMQAVVRRFVYGE